MGCINVMWHSGDALKTSILKEYFLIFSQKDILLIDHLEMPLER